MAAIFNQKAKLWIRGRSDIYKKLAEAINHDGKVIWMHCASLGEFEQGRPILEKLKETYPDHKLLLTFFSPSGYEIRKNYPGVDWVFYLPLDTLPNVKNFLNIVSPQLVIFVKYEYWYNYLNQLNKRQIPTILISAIFREKAIFFKWYGGLHRKMLHLFSHLFVQNEESFQRIAPIVNTNKITVAGDSRFDRVLNIAKNFTALPAIENFVAGKQIVTAGSTWPDDEKMLKNLLVARKELSLIIAPHEITESHINFILSLFPEALLYSELDKLIQKQQPVPNARVLIINNIGMLYNLYNYCTISYIGGGFNKSGIHNILEAAVYGKPVIFGPNYTKFAEAVSLIKKEGAFSYNTDNELITIFSKLLSDQNILEESSKNAAEFVSKNSGATTKILNWLKQISF